MDEIEKAGEGRKSQDSGGNMQYGNLFYIMAEAPRIRIGIGYVEESLETRYILLNIYRIVSIHFTTINNDEIFI